jgi:hypothetical protein
MSCLLGIQLTAINSISNMPTYAGSWLICSTAVAGALTSVKQSHADILQKLKHQDQKLSAYQDKVQTSITAAQQLQEAVDLRDARCGPP